MAIISIKATQLKPGNVMVFNTPRIDFYVDTVEDTRDGDVLVRCGYSKGDDSTTMFFGQEEKVLILG